MITLRHALKNMLIPVVTLMGLQLGVFLGGAVVTETVFAWPGVGRLAIVAIGGRDYPMVQSAVLVLAIIFTLVNLLVDIAYMFLDPRIRYA
jgi:peptide/nickel transport system permease protein